MATTTRRTKDLLPGDRIRTLAGAIRTVQINNPPNPRGVTHWVKMADGSSLMAQPDTEWPLLDSTADAADSPNA